MTADEHKYTQVKTNPKTFATEITEDTEKC